MRQFLRGEIVLREEPVTELLCALSGERIALSPADAALLASLPASDWTAVETLLEQARADAGQLERLVERRALVGDHQEHASLRNDEERLASSGWHDMAAVYQTATQWRGASGDEASREHNQLAEASRLASHIQRFGMPPQHFAGHDEALANLPLALPETDELLATLQRRRTVRAFRTDEVLGRTAFDYLMYAVFGVFGVRHLPNGLMAIKRTSPSGGGLHPIEAYVIAVRVEGLRPGLYHYRTRDHSLDLLREFDESGARAMITRYTAGQAYFAEAHAAVIHVARFGRHFWKYVDHRKAFKAVLMDSAHLSQTLYTVAAHLGLGAWYTAAINDADIGDELGFAPTEAGAVALSGFGLADPSRRELEFVHEPYSPVAARDAGLAGRNKEG